MAVGAALLAGVLISAPSASAAPMDTYAAAFAATAGAASTTGIDIVVVSTSNQARALGGNEAGVPPRSSVRMHYEANPKGAEYTSVRIAQTKRLLGAWGRNASEGSWATLSSLYGQWPTLFARSRAMSVTTAVTNLDDRMPSLSLHRGSQPVALALLVSPSADSGFADEIDWDPRGVSEVRQPDGSVLISAERGFGDAEAGDECTYGPIQVTIREGLIRSTKWQRNCPNAEVSRYTGTVEYEPQVDGATTPKLTEQNAFARSTRPPVAGWQLLANAANATAATAFASVSVANQRGFNDPGAGVIAGLDFLDELMRYGNAGVPQQVGGGAPGETTYRINPARGQGFLLQTKINRIDGMTVVIAADGVITSIETSVGNPVDRYLATFNR